MNLKKKQQLYTNRDYLIILPVLNEVNNIIELTERIRSEMNGLKYIICYIDDGSTDGTFEIINDFMIDGYDDIFLLSGKKLKYGCQRGGALKRGLDWGLENTTCKIFIEMDGDLSHRPEELRTGIDFVESGKCDIAIASKYLPESRILNRSLGRNLVSLISTIAMRLVITHKIKDYSNGLRFYSQNAAHIISQHVIKYHSPIYLSEVLGIWLRNGMKVIEFPTIYVGRHEDLSKVKWIDLAKAGIAAFEISWRYHFSGFKHLKESS